MEAIILPLLTAVPNLIDLLIVSSTDSVFDFARDSQFVSKYVAEIDNVIAEKAKLATRRMAIELQLLLFTVANISLIVVGYAAMHGWLPNLKQSLLVYFLKFNFIMAVFFNIEILFDTIYAIIVNQPGIWFSTALERSHVDVYSSADNVFMDCALAVESILVWNPLRFVCGFLLAVSTVLFTVSILVPLCVARIILATLLIISPIILLCVMFDRLKGMTEAWFRQLLISMITLTLLPILVTLLSDFTLYFIRGTNPDALSSIFIVIFVVTVDGLIILQIPGLAKYIADGATHVVKTSINSDLVRRV